VAYDCGFAQTLAHTQVPSWDKRLVEYMDSGISTEAVMAPRHVGSKSYVCQIDETCPGYLFELWQHALQTKGEGSTAVGAPAKFQDLANAMNEKSAAPEEQRPNLYISARQLEAWAKDNKLVAIKKQLSSFSAKKSQ
jgi:hypothetical protein